MHKKADFAFPYSRRTTSKNRKGRMSTPSRRPGHLSGAGGAKWTHGSTVTAVQPWPSRAATWEADRRGIFGLRVWHWRLADAVKCIRRCRCSTCRGSICFKGSTEAVTLVDEMGNNRVDVMIVLVVVNLAGVIEHVAFKKLRGGGQRDAQGARKDDLHDWREVSMIRVNHRRMVRWTRKQNDAETQALKSPLWILVWRFLGCPW